MLLGLECSFNPFSFTPTYKSLAALTPGERRRALHHDEIRSRIVAEQPDPGDFPGHLWIRSFDKMYALGDPPNYEPMPGDTIAARAEAAGVTPAELAYDTLLANDGQGILMLPSVNFAYGSLDASLEMLRHRDTIYGLGDGGAHLGFLCDASLPTYMLQYWARDRSRGETLPLEEVVSGLTSRTAAAVGLHDRGYLRAGYKADINIIDLDCLSLGSPRVAYDLPAGGRRITQDAKGYAATIVAGTPTYRDGAATGALPGRLVRGAQGAA
jgi:N-acyl-D-aspartate/D-glutamate deacylase